MSSRLSWSRRAADRASRPTLPGTRYYRAMRELFAPTEHACLVLADHGAGRSRSIAYGDFAIDKMGGWSAERGTIHSNELLAVGPGAQVPQI